jgi:hypothetical protein
MPPAILGNFNEVRDAIWLWFLLVLWTNRRREGRRVLSITHPPTWMAQGI